MAAAVNVFRTFTETVGLTTSIFYSAPNGYSGVVLLAQVTNVGDTTQTITFDYRRGVSGTDTNIVRNLSIPPKDTANLLAGKLVVETGDKLTIVGSTATDLKFLSSILETSNI
jgi:hypothetical protein|tara:strand:+ start:337 stop:675 length:339 start_codon:yes stop_codon:yes gene_type:complete